MPRHMRIIYLALIFSVFTVVKVYANEPYRGYTYDSFGHSVSAPNGYEPERIITGVTAGAGMFKNPEDMFFEETAKKLYVADSGNKRIVILDRDLKYAGVIDRYYDNGKETEFGLITGIYVIPSGGLIIAEKENSRILHIDFDGNLLRTYTRPESEHYLHDSFLPQKVLADSAMNVYALCSGVFEGAVVFDNQGEFTGYYGSTLVKPNLRIIASRLWKRIMSEEQKFAMERYVPVEFTSFDIDSKDFVYTVTQSDVLSNNSIRKLNPKGVNMLRPRVSITGPNVFGDAETYVYKGNPVVTQFIDIDTDSRGFINALDISGGKIFQHDSEGNLIFIFGQSGSQKGTFKQAWAIESVDDRILVLDKQKSTITGFQLTEFGNYVHQAIEYYNKGMYEQAQGPWLEVLKRNNNYELAYIGLGAAAMNLYQYEDAMRYFKLGNDRMNYSRAFRQYRIDYVRQHFSGIIACSILLIAAMVLLKNRKRIFAYLGGKLKIDPKSSGGRTASLLVKIRRESGYLRYIAMHPLQGYEELTDRKAGSVIQSFVILALWFFSAVASRQLTGFPLNQNDTMNLEIFHLLVQTVIVFILWCISNWAFCTLMDGKGSFRQIWICSAYALAPAVVLSLLATLGSNFMTIDEKVFHMMLIVAGTGWSALLIVNAMKTIHDYTLGKTVLSIILSVFGVLMICFLAILSFSLYHQVYTFFKGLYNEIMFRL